MSEKGRVLLTFHQETWGPVSHTLHAVQLCMASTHHVYMWHTNTKLKYMYNIHVYVYHSYIGMV